LLIRHETTLVAASVAHDGRRAIHQKSKREGVTDNQSGELTETEHVLVARRGKSETEGLE